MKVTPTFRPASGAVLLLTFLLFAGCGRASENGRQVIECGASTTRLAVVGPRMLGVVTADREYQVWRIDGAPELVHKALATGNISTLDMMPVSDSLVAYGDHTERSLKVLEVPSARVVFSFSTSPDEDVQTIGANRSGTLVAWVEQRRRNPQNFRMRCADMRTGEVILDLTAPLVEPGVQRIGWVAISPDDKTIVFAGSQGTGAAGAIDLTSKTLLWHRKTKPRGGIWRIAFMPDSQSFFATDNCGYLTRYGTRTGEVLWDTQLKLRDLTPWGEQAAERLLALDVSPDGKYVAFGTDYSRGVEVWDIEAGERVKRFRVSKWPVESILVFSPDGKGIWAAGSQDRKIRYFPVP